MSNFSWQSPQLPLLPFYTKMFLFKACADNTASQLHTWLLIYRHFLAVAYLMYQTVVGSYFARSFHRHGVHIFALILSIFLWIFPGTETLHHFASKKIYTHLFLIFKKEDSQLALCLAMMEYLLSFEKDICAFCQCYCTPPWLFCRIVGKLIYLRLFKADIQVKLFNVQRSSIVCSYGNLITQIRYCKILGENRQQFQF